MRGLAIRAFLALVICAAVGFAIGYAIGDATRTHPHPAMPEQMQLPMPLDDGARDEITVYTIETEVE